MNHDGESRPSRRAVTSAGLGLAVLATLSLAGCTDEDGVDLPGLPPLGEEQPEPDRDLVLTALGHEQLVLDQVQRTRARHPGLRRALAGTAAVHRAHVELLTAAVEDPAAPPGRSRPVPRSERAALAELAAAERALSGQHVTTAMAAASGVFARLVAGLSAAAAQQSAVLTGIPVGKAAR